MPVTVSAAPARQPVNLQVTRTGGMAGLHTTSDDRLLTGGIVIAVWLAGLALVSLLLSLMEQRVTAPAAAPPASATPSVAPVETLPPTVVVAESDAVHPADCRPGERAVDERRCASPPPRRDASAEPPRREP